MESQEDHADPAKHTIPQEENEAVASVEASHNISSDPSEPFIFYSNSRWRISITHRYAFCRRILFVAPIISDTIQDIALQVVLYLSSIPDIITARNADAMLGSEYCSAGEVLSDFRALHEWLLLWAEDKSVHDSVRKVVVGVYWVVVVLMLLRLTSVEQLPLVKEVTETPCEEQSTQRTSKTTSSSLALHTYDDEPDTLYDGRVFEKRYDAEPSTTEYTYQGFHFHAKESQESPGVAIFTPLEYAGLEDRIKEPHDCSQTLGAQERYSRIDTSPKKWLRDDPSDKIWTPAPGPTPDTIVKSPHITDAGGASPMPDARNRGLKTNFSSMRNKRKPPQNQEDEDQEKKDQEKKDHEKKDHEEKNQEKEYHEEKYLEKKDQEKRDQEKRDQEKRDQEKRDQEKRDQEKRDQEKKDQEKKDQEVRNRIRRGKGKKKMDSSTTPSG
jgi:hypothetical protein